MIGRVLLGVAGLLAASSALAETTGQWPAMPCGVWCQEPWIPVPPRDGVIEQAISDTVYASLARRGIPVTGIAQAVEGVNNLVREHGNYIASCVTGWNGGNMLAGSYGWLNQIQCGVDALKMIAPYILGRGKTPYRQPTLGGPQASSGTWEDDCEEFEYKLDAEGNLVFPSAPLSVGARGVGYTNGAQPQEKDKYFYSTYWSPANSGFAPKAQADNLEAAVRWQLHKINGNLPRKDWWGIHFKQWTKGDGTFDEMCLHLSTVAYRKPDGTLVPRKADSSCFQARQLTNDVDERSIYPHDVQHRPCPFSESTGGDFHYYGDTPKEGDHWDVCTLYSPNINLGPDGYAISPVASMPPHLFGVWGPPHLRGCALNLDFLRRLADNYFKAATEKPGYTGPEYQPIQPQDVRPGDARVNDLADTPGYGQGGAPTNPAPNPDAPVPNPSPGTPPPPPPSGGTSPCMFGGLFGCSDPTPAIGAPGATPPPAGTAPTTGLNGLFDWLPDLPSISLDTSGAGCPTWALDASAFGGTGWSWTLESHCDLMEANRAPIGLLFITLFGFMSALIILRA